MNNVVVEVTIVILCIYLSVDAHATSCEFPELNERLARVDAVFQGTVLGVEEDENGVMAVVAVESVWKGPLSATLVVTAPPVSSVFGGVVFEVGERRLVFATLEQGNELFTFLCFEHWTWGVTPELLGPPCASGGEIAAREGESCGVTQLFRRGDWFRDGTLNELDAYLLFRYLFDEQESRGCLDAGDVNDDGKLDVSDVVGLLGVAFHGVVMPPPTGACGLDPTDDVLSCDTLRGCT